MMGSPWLCLSLLLVGFLCSTHGQSDVCKARDGESGHPGNPGRPGRPGQKGDKGDPGRVMMMIGHVILFALLIAVDAVDPPCGSSIPGLHGIPGTPGRDGRDGLKGSKGEKGLPARLNTATLKGEKGTQGPQGPVGKNGPKGPPGPPGEKGERGPRGDNGMPGNHKRQYQSAFTVKRNTGEHPKSNAPIKFNDVITNDHGDYNRETGKFVCRIAGLYYFTYHASHSHNLCVSLRLDDEVRASFCDHMSNTHQVTSGGALLQLNKGQEVWLVANDYNGMIGIDNNDSVFTGFLVFPD